jgi:hypothetical protein
MRNTWSKQLSKRPWGRRIRCSIKLRRELGREPTRKEVNEGLDTDDKYFDVTPNDIARAFLQGQEVGENLDPPLYTYSLTTRCSKVISVWTMKCIDYDIEFQKTIVEQFATWTKPKKTKKEAKPAKKPTPKKRKLTEMDDIESEDENEDYIYIPKGTQSRPH